MSNMPIEVDHASLSKASSDMRDSIEQVQGQLSKIRGQVSASSAFWTGNAANAFGGLMEEYNRKANRLQEVLQTIAGLVDKSADNHMQNEDLQNRTMNSMMSVLHGG